MTNKIAGLDSDRLRVTAGWPLAADGTDNKDIGNVVTVIIDYDWIPGAYWGATIFTFTSTSKAPIAW